MVSIFTLSGLSQKILQDILILKTNANEKKKKSVVFPLHPPHSWGKQRLSDLLLSSSLKQKGGVNQQEATAQTAIKKIDQAIKQLSSRSRKEVNEHSLLTGQVPWQQLSSNADNSRAG